MEKDRIFDGVYKVTNIMSSQKQNQQVSLTHTKKKEDSGFSKIKHYHGKFFRVLKKILKEDELDTEIFQEKKKEDPKNNMNHQENPELNNQTKTKK